MASTYIVGTANQITATPSSGSTTLSIPNTFVVGTANQITVTHTSGSSVLSIPSTFVTPGSIHSTTGNLTLDNGNLILANAGNKIIVATGANSALGVTVAMSGSPGSVTVNSTAIDGLSFIQYCRATGGGTLGNVSISAQSSGSFTLTSDANETSTFNYLILN